MKSTTLVALSLALLMCLALAACGQRASSTTTASGTPTATQPGQMTTVSDADVDSSAQKIDQGSVDTSGLDTVDSDADAVSTASY